MNKIFVFSATFCVLIAGAFANEACIICSSENDPQCVQSPHLIAPIECRNTTTGGCFTRIVDGHTVRGCLADIGVETCGNNQLCSSCYSVNQQVGCNSQQFPDVRLFCHQCNGDLESPCAPELTNSSTICNIFSEIDQCFIRRTNTSIQRGCLSSSGTSCAERSECFLCDGHGCNLLAFSHDQIPIAPGSGANISAAIILIAFTTLFNLVK